MAFDALRGQRLRTGLSVLGISIGIAAVVGTVALGDAAHERLLGEFAKFALGRIELWSDATRLVPGATPKGFKTADLDVLRTLPGVHSVSPRLESNDTARYGAHSAGVQIVGLRHGDLPGYQQHVVDGRELSPIEETEPVQVAMIDVRLRNRLFGENGRALAQTVLIGNQPYTVVGIVDRDSTSGFDGGIDHVFVSARTWQAKVNPGGQITNMFVRMNPDADSRALGEVIERTLLRQHGQHDFDLWNSDDSYRDASMAVGMVQLVLSVIAGISLLVGGVGVMNIMLVAVTERTPEIGIRMAVGARPSDVQLQFLSEAIVLCAVGGAVGVAMVALLAMGVNLVQHQLALHVSLTAVLTAIGVSSLIGVTFGFLPARQASRLSPVVALARE
jgi:macrolide transport system ATP-binding/permease protein